jgi:hypothetical protein
MTLTEVAERIGMRAPSLSSHDASKTAIVDAMHRVDITDACGARMVLTAEHDGVLVDDVVREWADRHGRPFRLELTGPAGGSWSRGDGGPELSGDAIDFCRRLSGRAPAEGPLATQVPV